jgi:hypothetical protein
MKNDHTEGVSTVPDPEERGLGPAMRVLSPARRRFAMAAVMFPFAKDWQIAKAAGYSDRSHGSLRVRAHENFHDEKVLAAIRECADREVRGGAMLGVATIKKIVRRDDHRDQFKAAVWLAAMNDFAVAQNINVKQTIKDESGTAILSEIKALAAKHGIPLPVLLGQRAAPVVEGEFEEVENG